MHDTEAFQIAKYFTAAQDTDHEKCQVHQMGVLTELKKKKGVYFVI